MAQSNEVDKEIERLKKEHPEYVVGGEYLPDPTERAAAQEKLKKLQEAEEQKKNESSKEDKRIESNRGVLLGEDASQEITSEDLKKAVGGIELDAALGNAEAVRKRQHLLDSTKYKKEVKTPNPGKPPHNEDPFPVDLKIEELEVHKPDVKIYEVTTHVNGQAAAEAAMKIGDTAEKRIVKLENMMATLTRYLFRLGSRVQINCVYYGGQTPFEKYKCIRCMHDDRISDGQMIQIDQCMACTRYEPVLGQVYEIMNDLGANVATILDDNQMAYMSMDDYADLSRNERYHTEKAGGTFDLSQVQKRDANDQDFKDKKWSKGIEMDWHLVPKEDQKTHINWRQSINDDGSNLKRLASFPTNEANNGSNILGGGSSNIFKKNKDAMDSNSNTALSSWIEEGKKMSTSLSDELTNKIKGGWAKEIRTALNGQSGIDPLAIAAMAYVENSSDISSIISKYVDIKGTVGVDNPALIISAYACGVNAIMGDNGKIPRIDAVTKPADSKDGSSSSSNQTTKETYHLNWDNRDTWFWTEFAEPLAINAAANDKTNNDVSFFARVCYLYMALLPLCKSSRYDGDWAAFPFTDEQIENLGLTFTSKYGYRDNRIHHGIDICGPHGTEIHAIADGTVVDPSGWGAEDCNAVIVQHENSIVSKYLHNSEVVATVGQHISKGDVVSKMGGWGSGHDGAYVDHLHLEIGTNGLEGSNQNPVDYYPLLAGHEPERGAHYFDLKTEVDA